MNYDKGEQLTVGKLKRYLSCLPDDIKIRVGIGSETAPVRYLLNKGGELLLHPDCYMQNAEETTLKTIISFQNQ